VLIINELIENIIIPPFLFLPFNRSPSTTFPILPASKTWRTDLIPKIIHQTAPSDKSRWNPIWEKCQQSWKDKFPDYEYKLWTDEDLDEFISTKYSWFYPTYQGYNEKIKRIDSARYFILYEYGGIYADMDYECIENFETCLTPGKVLIAESKFKEHPIINEKYQNALMVSPANHPFWNYVIRSLDRNKYVESVLFATGPNVVKEAAYECEPEMFKGLPHGEFTEGEKWSRHYGTSSWRTNLVSRHLCMFLCKIF
jgi:mannosyltransferase OCH1-like enzyme